MRHFRITARLWLAFGALGFLYTTWHAALMSGVIYRMGGLGELVVEILGCVFTLAAALAGYGLLRGWQWPRLAIEVLGAVLLTLSLIALFFSEVVITQRILIFGLASLFALYSLIVTLFVKYEYRQA